MTRLSFTKRHSSRVVSTPSRSTQDERNALRHYVCAPLERSELRSVTGSLQWLAGRTHPDAAFSTNRLQKRCSAPTVADLKEANKPIKEVKKHGEVGLRVRPLRASSP